MSRRQRGTFGLTLIAVLAAACSDPSTAPQAAGGSNDAHTTQSVSELSVTPSSIGWQAEARALAAAHNMSPLAAARVYAALGVAQYRAVRGIHDPDRDGKLPENGVGTGGRAALEARRGAVAGASAEVLSFFFPGAETSLDDRVEAESKAGPGRVHPRFVRGVGVGRAAGAAMVERTMNDGFTVPWTGTVPVGPGKWIANGPPAGATFGGVTPYFMESGAQFRPPPPPVFGSPAFLADLDEIKNMAVARTPEQTASALYWNFPTGTHTPVGYWNELASDYVEAYGLNELAATRAFALTNAAMMDALIGCWEAKYYYWTIRPSQADPAISLTFGLPNHPSYPSGHSCVSAAATTVLGTLFPDRAGETAAWLTEAGLSRMYAGIHYRFDIDAGADLGVAVAQWALAREHRLN